MSSVAAPSAGRRGNDAVIIVTECLDNASLEMIAARAGMLLFSVLGAGGFLGRRPFTVVMSESINNACLRVIAAGAGVLFFSCFGTSGFFSRRPFAVVMTERFDPIGYIAVMASGTGVSCITAFCAGRRGYNRLIIMTERINDTCLKMIAARAGVLFFSVLCTGSFLGCCPVSIIVSQRGNIFVEVFSASAASICDLSFFFAGCFIPSYFYKIMTEFFYRASLRFMAARTGSGFFAVFRTCCFLCYRPLPIMSERVNRFNNRIAAACANACSAAILGAGGRFCYSPVLNVVTERSFTGIPAGSP